MSSFSSSSTLHSLISYFSLPVPNHFIQFMYFIPMAFPLTLFILSPKPLPSLFFYLLALPGMATCVPRIWLESTDCSLGYSELAIYPRTAPHSMILPPLLNLICWMRLSSTPPMFSAPYSLQFCPAALVSVSASTPFPFHLKIAKTLYCASCIEPFSSLPTSLFTLLCW